MYAVDDGHVRVGRASGQRQELTEDMVTFVRGLVEGKRQSGGTISGPAVHDALVLKYGAAEVPNPRSLRRRLAELGIYTLPVKSFPKRLRTDTAAWRQREILFLRSYAKALDLQRRGEAVLVYLDESFIHVGHRRGRSLVDTTVDGATVKPHRSGLKGVVNSGTGRGRMLIILHAITRDGLLCTRNADGSYWRVAEGAVGEQLSAERVWPSGGKGTEDYHNSMDGEMFERWIQHQVLPTFRRLYPGKRCVLVMDNAPSHRRWRDDHLNPTTAAKQVCADVLMANGIMELHVDRDGTRVTFPSAQWQVRAPHGPSADELQLRLQRLFQLKPWLNRTRLDDILTAAVRAQCCAR